MGTAADPSAPPVRRNTIMSTTLVIGAGPAGLAVGACLTRAGVRLRMLEQTTQVAASWQRHYDRLHLHTPKAASALPFVPLPRHYPRYPSRHQMQDYFAAYAQRFHLEPTFGQTVIMARYTDRHWDVQTQDTRYRAPYLVIATGYTRAPHVPAWPGQHTFQGPMLHSSVYRTGAPFKNQRVLVVGFGNSGAEIALDLWEHGADPHLAVRSAVNILPRDLCGIPMTTIGIVSSKLPPWVADALSRPLLRMVIGDLTPYGLRPLPYGPMTQIQRDGRIPVIDVGTIARIKRGHIKVHPGVEAFTDTGVLFTDGTHAHVDAVILATGYRPRVNAFLPEGTDACDDNGMPTQRGRASSIADLYFCGFSVAATGMLREIAHEAKQISAHIANQDAQRAAE